MNTFEIRFRQLSDEIIKLEGELIGFNPVNKNEILVGVDKVDDMPKLRQISSDIENLFTEYGKNTKVRFAIQMTKGKKKLGEIIDWGILKEDKK